MPQGTIIIETIASDVLRGNALGDPTTRRVPIYLPPQYADGATRFPVVFVLTGFTGRGTMCKNSFRSWTKNTGHSPPAIIAR
jgi:enterochelin esterase family protein